MWASLVTVKLVTLLYLAVDRAAIEQQMDTLYKIVHIVNFNTSIQALMLLHQVTDVR